MWILHIELPENPDIMKDIGELCHLAGIKGARIHTHLRDDTHISGQHAAVLTGDLVGAQEALSASPKRPKVPAAANGK